MCLINIPLVRIAKSCTQPIVQERALIRSLPHRKPSWLEETEGMQTTMSQERANLVNMRNEDVDQMLGTVSMQFVSACLANVFPHGDLTVASIS